MDEVLKRQISDCLRETEDAALNHGERKGTTSYRYVLYQDAEETGASGGVADVCRLSISKPRLALLTKVIHWVCANLFSNVRDKCKELRNCCVPGACEISQLQKGV